MSNEIGDKARGMLAAHRWVLAGYAGIAGFLTMEALLRKPGSAASLKASEDDKGTTRAIITAAAIAAVAPPILRRTPMPELPRAAAATGVALQVVGLATRAVSMRTLGRFYSRTLRATDEQRVVDTGPYRLVRHPGYTGSLLLWTGFALSTRSLPVVAVVAGLFGSAYRKRIAAEELLLRRDLPGYLAYSERTKRLIPYVW
ncbi:MAG TPA: isoprenylcysteine carboxylmethyltransferase family protein [Pseudonocardiaceae bacterium]|nr:isoprenylcysteine carboxylmethyltransferase family protein [Pseudonocardiaceae bacterium]